MYQERGVDKRKRGRQ